MQLCGSLSILWHCLSLGLEWKLTFSSPVATAELSKFTGILSAALSRHHLSGFGIAHGPWIQLSSVQSLSCVRLFVTPWTAAHQASLSIPNSHSSPKPMSFESVMPSSPLILCHPLLLLPSIFSSIRIFSNESALCIRCPKYWSFSFNISPSNEHSGLL